MGTGMMTTVEQADMATDMTDMTTETGAMTDTKTEGMIDMMTTVVVRQRVHTSAISTTGYILDYILQKLLADTVCDAWLIDRLAVFSCR